MIRLLTCRFCGNNYEIHIDQSSLYLRSTCATCYDKPEIRTKLKLRPIRIQKGTSLGINGRENSRTA